MAGIVYTYVGHSRSGRNTAEYVQQFFYFCCLPHRTFWNTP